MNTNCKQTSSSKTHNIIQWNCHGIKPNFNELLILISLLNPATICLQETFLKENPNLKTLNYKQYHYIHNTGHWVNGGTSILVRNDIPQSQFPIKSKLQAVATQVTLHKTITICSIYIPPHEQINETELKNLIKQLTKPFILLGDFNSHNTLWGSQQTKGSKIEQLINNQNLCLLNQKEPTHINPTNASPSSIDLTLCDPSSFMEHIWSTYDYVCRSDHYPIIIRNNIITHNHAPRWNTNKANWEKFCQLCSIQLIKGKIHTIEKFTKTLITLAEACIPKNWTSFHTSTT